MFTKIVVGTDGSDASERALRLACDLAKKYGSEMHLVHTPHPQTVAFAMGAVAGYHAATTMPSAEEVQKSAVKIIDAAQAIAKECGQPVSEAHVAAGDAAEQIVKAANDCGADLIVTGRRGLGGLGSIVLGSTTQRVNHLAECACLSVV